VRGVPKVTARDVVFGIGVPRSGTTWLHANLAAHPAVHALYKGINYFNSSYVLKKTGAHYERGDAWYLSRFRPEPGQICADVCVSYFVDKDACRRIRKFNPEAKIVITLRNPYEAVHSHYIQYLRGYNLKKTFLEVIRANENNFLEANLLHAHLMRFFSAFDRNNLLICLYEDLQKDPRAYARRIYRFLGVDEDFVPPAVDREVNQRQSVRSVRLRNLQSGLTEAVRSRPRLFSMVNWIYDHVIPREWVYKVLALNDGGSDLYHPPGEEEIRCLEDFYQSDLERFLAMPEFRHLDWSSRPVHAAAARN